MAKPKSRWRRGRAAVAALFLASLTGCPTQHYEEPKRPRATTDAEDEFAEVESSEWFFATTGVTGGRQQLCQHVLGWVLGEGKCQGASCRHGSRLASDWMQECASLSPKAAKRVEQLQAQLAARAELPPTPCTEELQRMLRDGCRKDAACEQHAQQWATRCGSTDGTPLAVLMLEKVVEQTLARPHKVSIDPRSCDELGRELRLAAGCKRRFECPGGLAGFLRPPRRRQGTTCPRS